MEKSIINFSKLIATAGIKHATKGTVENKDIEEFTREQKASQAWEGASLWERIEAHAQKEKAFDEFAKALTLLAEELSNRTKEAAKGKEPSQQNNSTHKPLIFIIDELDRCRPPFALEELESIEHYFSTQNVHFVLSTNLEQLANSVRHEYGVGIALHASHGETMITPSLWRGI